MMDWEICTWQKDKINAIASFKKTLSLKAIPETKEKLDILLKEKK